jgi:hypothetical protein
MAIFSLSVPLITTLPACNDWKMKRVSKKKFLGFAV